MSGKPDYEIKIKHKDAKYGVRVGAAWRTKDGSGVNLKLDPGISVSTPDGVFLTLWPFESKEDREQRFAGGGGRAAAAPRGGPRPQDDGDFNADDIGF
jgi:hypothetical protein